MRLILTAALMCLAAFSAHAEGRGVTVIELYTSQGCSSCPPADQLLAEMSDYPDLIPLALHVDYWDYLGWKDDMADPSYTRRQQNYAQAAGSATVYTPQMIIGGVHHVVGSRTMQAMEAVQTHRDAPDPVQVNLTRSDRTLEIWAERVNGPARPAVVQLVRYTPELTRDIRRGENAGKRIRYVNVVTSWQVIGQWDMAQPLAMRATVSGDDPIVVIVQEGTNGPIHGAAALR